MRKTIIIIGSIVFIVIIGAIVFSIISHQNSTETSSGGSTGTLPIATATTPYTPPTGTTLTIGTPSGNVMTNNFYNDAQAVSADHTSILIQKTDNYNISYYSPDSSFNIFISGTPFQTVESEAQSAFLQALGISEADACKLNVKIGTSVEIDPNDAGQNLGLSFCNNSAFQPQ